MFKRKTKDRIAEVAPVLDGFELPTFPNVVAEALGKLGEPDAHLSEVADIVLVDPGISATLLQLANSAATGLRNPVRDLRQVVAILGRNQVESILIGAAVKSSLPKVRSEVFDSTRFWRAAAERAVVAGAVTARLDPARRSEAFTAALLQDMALPVLIDSIDGYEDLLLGWYEGEIDDLASAEHGAFGWDHGAVAGLMGTTWQFPDTLLESLTAHHDQLDSTIGDWTRLVADWREVDGEASRAALLDRAATIDQLQGVDCEGLVDEALANVGEVAAMFG